MSFTIYYTILLTINKIGIMLNNSYLRTFRDTPKLNRPGSDSFLFDFQGPYLTKYIRLLVGNYTYPWFYLVL